MAFYGRPMSLIADCLPIGLVYSYLSLYYVLRPNKNN
jgi:hypothetical protein